MHDDDWRIPDPATYSDFQRTLLEEKGGATQRNFLYNICKGQPFLEQIAELPKRGSKPYPTLGWKHMFTDREFVNPPPCTEAKIYDHWKELNPFFASQPSFWAQATVDIAKSGYIHPSFLAKERRVSGKQRIERMLVNQSAKENDKAIDACVRDILRRMSGIQRDRGNRSIFVNCILARAWWRERLIRRVANEIGAANSAVGATLRISALHWEYFATAMVSRNPVFGNEIVQSAVVASLMGLQSDSSIPSSLIQEVCQQTCVLGAIQELPIMSAWEIRLLINNIIAEIQSSKNTVQGEPK